MKTTKTPDAPAGMLSINTTVATLLGRVHPEPEYWWDRATTYCGGGEIHGWHPGLDQDVCWAEWSIATTDDEATGLTVTFYPDGYDSNWPTEEMGRTTIDLSVRSRDRKGMQTWPSGAIEKMIAIAAMIRKDNHR